MTIPSLDGNGGNTFNVNIKPLNPVPPQEPIETPNVIPDDASAGSDLPVDINLSDGDAVGAQASSDVTPMQDSAPVQQPQPQPQAQIQDSLQMQANNSKPVEDEYSIKQFRKDYQLRLEKDVMPILNAYEKERKTRLMWALIGSTICVIIGLVLFMNLEGRAAGDSLVVGFGGACGFWMFIKKSFEKKIKRLIMPTLMKAMHGFKWLENPLVGHQEIKKTMLFANVDKAAASFDDCFSGEYRKVPIAISECEYTIGSGRSKRTLFEGAVIRIKMNKNFDGITVIRPKYLNSDVRDLKKAKLDEVKLEDTEFCKDFVVYSTDQIESRYLLTTAFIQRFKDISMAFFARDAFCSFCNDAVYIAPYCSEDLFALCSLTKPLANKEQFEELFNEIVSILQLVDHFKLDKKLGL